MRPKVVVVGSVNMDIVLRTPRLPAPGETITGRSLAYAPGGKGANQAVAAARLGADVAMVARAGDDAAGASMRENLVANGVNAEHVTVTAGAPQGIAVIIVDDAGQNSIVLAAGSNGLLSAEDVDRAAPIFQGARVCLLQNEVSLEATRRAARCAKAAGALVVWNPAPAPDEVPPGLAESVDVIAPNESEAERLTGLSVRNADEARAAAEALRAKGFGAAVVTMGENGAFWCGPDLAFHTPARRVEVVDTTAAGDTFLGALAVALAEDQRPEAAVEFASAAAAFAVTRLGAQDGMPTRKMLEF